MKVLVCDDLLYFWVLRELHLQERNQTITIVKGHAMADGMDESRYSLPVRTLKVQESMSVPITLAERSGRVFDHGLFRVCNLISELEAPASRQC